MNQSEYLALRAANRAENRGTSVVSEFEELMRVTPGAISTKRNGFKGPGFEFRRTRNGSYFYIDSSNKKCVL